MKSQTEYEETKPMGLTAFTELKTMNVVGWYTGVERAGYRGPSHKDTMVDLSPPLTLPSHTVTSRLPDQ